MRPLRQAYPFFAPDRARLSGIAGLLLAGTALAVLKPWPIAIAIDSLIGDQPVPAWLPGASREVLLVALTAATFLIHAAVALVLAAGHRMAIEVGLNGLRRVRGAVFEKLQTLPIEYHLRHPQGDLIQRATWDTCAFQTIFQQGFVTVFTAGLSLALMIVVMARLNLALTLVTLATLPPLLIAIRVCGPRMMRAGSAAQERDGRLASRVQQNIAATSVIRAFNHEPAEIERFGTEADTSRNLRGRQHGLEIAYLAVVAIVFGGGIAAILMTGATQVTLGRATVGDLIVFIAYLSQFYEPLNQLSNVGVNVSTAGAGVERVCEILDTRGEAELGEDPPPPRGELEFRNVSFSFGPGKTVLSEINLTIAPGEVIALVGPSGAGKSTLLHLLQRFREPTTGEILAGELPLRSWSRAGWHRSVTAIQQEPVLLPGTIADNIALGNPDASREEIVSAAKATRADGFIRNCEHAYETIVGEGSARLSVGESQRVNLARAFLKQSPILLLDEPTSALDTDSESAVAESLGVLSQGRTTLVVSHRQEVMKYARRVIVLENGRVTADGTPDAVAASNEFFRRMRGSER